MKTNNTTEVKVTPLAAAIHAQLNPAPAHTNSPPASSIDGLTTVFSSSAANIVNPVNFTAYEDGAAAPGTTGTPPNPYTISTSIGFTQIPPQIPRDYKINGNAANFIIIENVPLDASVAGKTGGTAEWVQDETVPTTWRLNVDSLTPTTSVDFNGSNLPVNLTPPANFNGAVNLIITATDSSGDQAFTENFTGSVIQVDDYPDPTCEVGIDQSGGAGTTLTADYSSISDVDNVATNGSVTSDQITSYEWKNGETVISGGAATFTHTITADGNYSVKVSYTDEDGHLDSLTSASMPFQLITDPGGNHPPSTTTPTTAAASPIFETDSTLSTSGTIAVVDTGRDVTTTVVLIETPSLTSGSTFEVNVPALESMLLATVNNGNEIGWGFDSGAEYFKDLKLGESLTLTYDIGITDSFGASTTHQLALTINGTDELPYVEPAKLVDQLVVVGGSLTDSEAQTHFIDSNHSPSQITFTAKRDGSTDVTTLSGWMTLDTSKNIVVTAPTLAAYGNHVVDLTGTLAGTFAGGSTAPQTASAPFDVFVSLFPAGELLVSTANSTTVETLQSISSTAAASYAHSSQDVTVSLATTAPQVTGHGTDILRNIKSLIGSPHNDSLTGNSGNNTLDGGAGNDALIGGTGDDIYIVDSTNIGQTGDVITEAVSSGSDTVWALTNYMLPSNVEKLTLKEPTGAGSGLTAIGNVSANTLIGGDGNDTLDGSFGVDSLQGGNGDDVYIVDSTSDKVVESVGEGNDRVESTATFTLSANVENLTLLGAAAINGTGNTGNNSITGNSAANILNGGTAGTDTLSGKGGADTYIVDHVDVTVDETGGSVGERDLVKSSVNFTLPEKGAADVTNQVEDLTLTGSAISATGNTFSNKLIGNNSNNVFVGGGGSDTMTGGSGDDTYTVDSAGDSVVELNGLSDGKDTILSSIDLVLPTNVEVLTLTDSALKATGNSADNTLNGNGGSDNTGVGHNNVLNGAGGSDVMSGGYGSDTYYVDNSGDVVNESNAQGNDTVYSTIDYTLPAYVENLTLTGGAETTGSLSDTSPNDDGVGNTLPNTLTGNTGKNILNGKAGNDSLDGGLGDDTLIGGLGGDQLRGGGGADVFKFTSATDSGKGIATPAVRDTILDFGSSDKIDLSGIDAITTNIAGTNDVFHWIGNAAFSGVAGELRYSVISVGGINNGSAIVLLQGDVNGGGVDFEIQVVGLPGGNHLPVIGDFSL